MSNNENKISAWDVLDIKPHVTVEIAAQTFEERMQQLIPDLISAHAEERFSSVDEAIMAKGAWDKITKPKMQQS